MILGNEFDDRIYDSDHVEAVTRELRLNFSKYFVSFADRPLKSEFDEAIRRYEKEQASYRDYMDLEALEEFEYDAAAFKSHTRKKCPIIRNCLNSQDEVMDAYKRSFGHASGRDLLDPVRRIAEFGQTYALAFNDTQHLNAEGPQDLGLDALNGEEYGCQGVIGYGVQSSLLYGVHARCFANRSQNAVWSLYFLSDHKDFGLEDGNEFMMVRPKDGTAEQNYFYPAQLFGYYALQVYRDLQEACKQQGIHFVDTYRYVYLSVFTDHIAETHRNDINVFKRSSSYVESQPWF